MIRQTLLAMFLGGFAVATATVTLAQSEHFSLNAEQAQAQAVRFLADLVRIDTPDPPGSESEAAHYLEGVLKSEGIESEIHHSIHGRVSMPYCKSIWSRIFQGSLRREALPNRRFYVLGKIPWGTEIAELEK